MRLLFFLLFILGLHHSTAQTQALSSENIADCNGATVISNPGSYSFQFTGGNGIVEDLTNYPSLKNIPEKNSAWFYFTAPHDGRFSIDAKSLQGKLQLIIFQNEEDTKQDICSSVFHGTAEIKRLIANPKTSEIGLSLLVDENHLYPIELKKDKQIVIFFQSMEKGKNFAEFKIQFESQNSPNSKVNSEKTVDLRKQNDNPTLNIQVRDIETGNPIVADLNISGHKTLTGLYNGSDFYFTIDRAAKLDIKCDAPGYFFNDRQEPISSGSDHELVIYLQPVGEGKTFKIEEIEFIPGSSEFLSSADLKLKRLKDFLVLNSGVKIEIQGHVFAAGEETSFAAMRLSEARAKRVYNYLVDAGISKDRMTHKGYGGTMTIYAKPKFAYEEQANRRVEIKIIE